MPEKKRSARFTRISTAINNLSHHPDKTTHPHQNGASFQRRPGISSRSSSITS
jgi:hypothetical protein